MQNLLPQFSLSKLAYPLLNYQDLAKLRRVPREFRVIDDNKFPWFLARSQQNHWIFTKSSWVLWVFRWSDFWVRSRSIFSTVLSKWLKNGKVKYPQSVLETWLLSLWMNHNIWQVFALVLSRVSRSPIESWSTLPARRAVIRAQSVMGNYCIGNTSITRFLSGSRLSLSC